MLTAGVAPVSELAIYPFEEPAASRTLVDILYSTILKHPTALAVDNGKTRLSYSELADRIAIQVEDLRSMGVGVGDRVGVRLSSGLIELYVSILSVLEAGAAYVPVDVDDPDERADLVWAEAGVCVVLTDNGMIPQFKAASGKQHRPRPEDDAWIIFTSGSTGKPKGVAVSHRSAAAFVDAEAQLFLPSNHNPLAPGDRVLAGLSVAFDASCEEMWLAWRHGACLVPAPRSLVKAGADLGAFLIAQRISVVSTVPTLAALWPIEALSALRLLILGGEACSPELATRLSGAVSGPVWNTYGPTEATVVSCAAPLVAGEPVRIGLPLKGWRLAVIGSDGCPVRWGDVGELVIGGVGMARYLDKEKDRAKFTPTSFFDGERMYRSGDLVRAERDGLLFVGRDDEQIKLGGRRIELGEIDAALMTLPGVNAAASAIRHSETGIQILVGYVVRNGAAHATTTTDRELLLRVLPATLVPMLITVDDLPIRTSGKVDRKALPWPPLESSTGKQEGDLPPHSTAAWLAEQWRRLLGMPASMDSNFFHLGGTSLAAAQLVSQVRQRCQTLSVADVYENPELKSMAARVDELSGTENTGSEYLPTARWVLLTQSLVQFGVIVALLSFEGLRWLIAIGLTKKFFAIRLDATSWAARYAMPWWLIIVGWVVLITMPGRLLTTAGVVRLITIGIRPGIYRRGGAVHLRLWAAERFVAQNRIAPIAGTQWCRRYARLLGCHVGADAQIHGLPPVTGLATFGDGCAVEPEADIAGWWLDGDRLHIGTITIGHGARVGTRSTLLPNTLLEPFADVQPGISVQGTVRGPESHDRDSNSSMDGSEIMGESFWTGPRYTVTLLLLDFSPIIMIAPVLGLTPALVQNYNNFRSLILALIEMTLPGAILGILLSATINISLVRLLSLAIRPGVHSWHSTAAWASWLTHGIMMELRSSLFPIYASLFTPTWLRLLGATMGSSVESSTVVPIPSLLSVRDGAFLADDVLLSPAELRAGRIRLGPSLVGVRAFVGNSAIVDPDVEVSDGSLIGVLSTAPDTEKMESGSSWLGRPPMSLPRRNEAPADETLTFKPPLRLRVARALVESCRLFPLLISAMLATLVGVGMLFFIDTFGNCWAILGAGGLLVAAGIASGIITIVAKWLLTPVIAPGKQRPLWSSFVWRNELADTFIQSLALPWLLRMCYGTPILPLWMRLLGATIGRGVWLESHLLPEAELVQLDDGVTINRGCVLQTHLFHDRLMRLDKVHLERGATLGPYAITLPGSTIGSGTTIAPTSLVMRGEHIPAGTRWKGNPVRPWSDEEKATGSSAESSDRENMPCPV